MTLEERILEVADRSYWYDSRELRAIAFEVRKREDRIKQLEEAGDRMGKLLPEGSICDKAVNAWRKAKEDKL